MAEPHHTRSPIYQSSLNVDEQHNIGVLHGSQPIRRNRGLSADHPCPGHRGRPALRSPSAPRAVRFAEADGCSCGFAPRRWPLLWRRSATSRGHSASRRGVSRRSRVRSGSELGPSPPRGSRPARRRRDRQRTRGRDLRLRSLCRCLGRGSAARPGTLPGRRQQ